MPVRRFWKKVRKGRKPSRFEVSMRIHHVVRTSETHRIDGGRCWCRPCCLRVPGGYIMIHNDHIGVALRLHPRHLNDAPRVSLN